MKPPCPKCAAADLPQDKCPHLSKRDPVDPAMLAFLTAPPEKPPPNP